MTGTGTHWHILGRRAGCSACFKPGAHAVTRCVMSLTLVLSCALSALHAYQVIYICHGVQSCYVRLRDGVDLACDVLLPSKRSESMKHTAVFFQTRYLRRSGFASSRRTGLCRALLAPLKLLVPKVAIGGLTGSCARRRYMRATELRWPLRLLSRGRAVDLVNLELKAALVNGGYAVVTVDVRGTGAALAALLPLHRTIVARSIVSSQMYSMVWPENAVLTRSALL